MGKCYSKGNKSSKKLFSGESYSNLDKTIFLQKLYMENSISKEEIFPFFTKIIYNQIIQEKKSKVKSRHFFKWFKMALSPYHNILSSLNKDSILNSLKKEKEKLIKKQKEEEDNLSSSEIPFFGEDISISEQGLRNYFFSNRSHFESRIIKSPPGTFRWTSWLIMSGVPISRSVVYYTNLLTYDLPDIIEEDIRKDLGRTMKKNEDNYKGKVNSLYRILRALANIDRDLGYTQGMNFLVSFLLNISNRNEIEVFYLLLSIFSHTFSKKFGMRGFFIDNFPLMHSYTNIFERKLKEFFPNIYQHFQKINLSSISWISFWMQQIYILVFPYEILLRIWDYFFIYGTNFLISFGLSIIDFVKDYLLDLKYNSDVQDFFQLLNPSKIIKRNNINDNIPSFKYDIEEILKNSIEKYYIKTEEIEEELKKSFPNYKNEFIYNYKFVESNPDVKCEFAIYALNNSKVIKSFSTSNDSTMKNSYCKIKNNSKIKHDNFINMKDNNKIISRLSTAENNKFNKILMTEEESLDLILEESEIEDSEDFQDHIKDIITRQNYIKKIYMK